VGECGVKMSVSSKKNHTSFHAKRKCAMVFCDRHEDKELAAFVAMPKVGAKNLHPKKWNAEYTFMTEACRRKLLVATLRDSSWCADHFNKANVRVCFQHVDQDANTFTIVPPERDPIYLDWLFRSLHPQYKSELPKSEEEVARLRIREFCDWASYAHATTLHSPTTAQAAQLHRSRTSASRRRRSLPAVLPARKKNTNG